MEQDKENNNEKSETDLVFAGADDDNFAENFGHLSHIADQADAESAANQA